MNRIERQKALPELLTVAEASDFFRVSRPTLVKALKDGQIDGVKIGSQWRVRRDPSKVGLKSFQKEEKMSHAAKDAVD